MKIFNNEIELIDLVVTDESYRYRQLVGENALTLTFSMPVFVDIPVNSYADFQGERYTLLKPKNFKKNNTRDFEYNLVLQSAQGLSSKYKYRDSTSKKLKFQNTAKPIAHLEMWVWNMNQRDSGWSIGECIDATEKLISFSHTYCDEALKMIAEAFNTEFEIVGKVVSIKKVEYNKTIADALPLSYGFGNGFNSGIKRDNFDNSKAIEILFVQGGDKNINVSEYGSAELLLPKNQSLVYEGKTYVSDEFGYSIRRLETEKPLVTKIEDSLDLSNISPQRVGTVSTVTVVDAVNNFYDFADASIPENLNYVTCLIAGEKLTVIFQSGILAGKEFDIAYTHATRNFAIVPQEIDGVTMPSEIFKPVVSDTYAVFGMSLPDAYICDNATKTGSSWDMFREAAKYFYENEDPRFTFSGELDGMWTAQDWVNIGGKIKLGAYAGFRDDQFQTDAVLMRMIGIRDLINDPYSPTIELSNVTVGGNSLSSALKKIDSNEVVAESIKKDTIRFAKRGFRDVKEASELLKKSLLNFSGAINPITVQAMQYIAGDESLQFVFVTNHTTTNETPHSESYDPITKQFSSAVGIIQHRTLGITTLSSSHAASEFKWWNMTAFISARLSESEKSYFVYAKCSKTANTGVFVLSESAIALEGVAGYYHLLMGIINSENENDRSYSQMYGYSEWTPGRFTIKKVASPSGNTFFDLENEVIQGNIKFQSGVTVETGISNAKSEAVQLASNDATTKANSAKDTAISTASADATTKANNAIQTAKDYATAVSELAEVTAKAHADGIVTAEEQRAIADATTKANNAQTSAINASAADATNKSNAAIQTSKEYSDSKVAVINQTIADLQTQSDGSISNWPSNTQSEAPTLSNFPASQWTSNTERDRHIIDVYTNYQDYISDVLTPNAGKSWKFVKSESGVYSWSLIADNNQSKAYLMSVKATAIANQKITTFSTIPNTLMADGFCYRKGDLWSLQVAWNGFTIGELLCAAQDSTSFVSGDWTKWVKYTDDTAVNNLVIGGRNLIRNTLTGEGWNCESHNNGEFSVTRSATSETGYIYSPPFDLEKRKEYTVSFKSKQVGNVSSCDFFIYNNPNIFAYTTGYNKSTEYVENKFTFIAGNADGLGLSQVSLRFDHNGGDGSSSTVFVKDIQVELGNVATSFTIAPEDIAQGILLAKQSGDNAQSTAVTAQNTVNSLNVYVDGSFKDGVISQSEAQAIEKYKNQVTKDFNDLVAGYNVIYSNSYLVGSAKTDLLNAKVTMAGAKDNLLASINSAIADGKTTVSEKADVDNKYSAWDSSFSSYKSKLELANKSIQVNLDNLSNSAAATAKDTAISTASADATTKANASTAVANAAQITANTVKDKIDNLQIGTVNLVSKSRVNSQGVDVNGYFYRTINVSENYIIPYFDFKEAGTYTLVFNAKKTANVIASRLFIMPPGWNGSTSLILYVGNSGIQTSDSKITFTFQVTSEQLGKDAYVRIDNDGTTDGQNGTIYVKDIMIVKGNVVPQSYTEAPEDTQAKFTALDYLKLAFGGSTEIIGGVVAANVMLLKNLQGAITAGISGLNDNVSFWHGGTYQNALDSANNPSAVSGIDRDDGSGHRAKGKLLWTKEGVLKMLAGFIGNFAIIGGRIVGKDTSGNEKLVLSTDNIPDIDSLSAGYTNCYYNDHSEITDGIMYQFTFFGGDEYGNLKNSDYGIESAEFEVPYATTVKFDRNIAGSYYWNYGSEYINNAWFVTNAKVYKNGIYVQDLAVGGVMTVSSACTLRFDIYTDMSVAIDYNQSAGCNVTVDIATAISFQEARSKTELGSNGFYSFFTNALVFYISATRGFIYKGKIDIPIGLGGGNVGSGGSYTQGWGLAYSTSRSGATTTINHNVIDPKFTVIIVPRNSFTWYLSATTASSSTTSNNGTATIVCSTTNAIFDFLIVRIS